MNIASIGDWVQIKNYVLKEHNKYEWGERYYHAGPFKIKDIEDDVYIVELNEEQINIVRGDYDDSDFTIDDLNRLHQTYVEIFSRESDKKKLSFERFYNENETP